VVTNLEVLVSIITAVMGLIAVGAVPWAFTLQRTIGEIKGALDQHLKTTEQHGVELSTMHARLNEHERRLAVLEYDASSDVPRSH